MRNSSKNTDCVKQKRLPEFGRVTVSVKRSCDKTPRVVTGSTLDEILRELAVNQDNDFTAKRNCNGNLNGYDSVVSNSSSINKVSGVKPTLNFSSALNKTECEVSKNRLNYSLNKERKRSRILKQAFVAVKQNSAFQAAQKMTGNNKEEKIELECPPKTDIGIHQNLEEKNMYELCTEENDFSNVIQEPVDGVTNFADESTSDICVIKEVFGNAVSTFSSSADVTLYPDYNDDVICLDSKESQLIVPKKTDDITKIKGWRRKQFFVEKPTTVEFHEFTYDTNTCKKISVEENHSNIDDISQDNKVENAFVCDRLDEFLEQDAELKINYEIPHLFAEIGIKLTKEEIASSPSLSEKDVKEVEMKYCRPVPSHRNIINSSDTKIEKIKRAKRPIEDDCDQESFKVVKVENNSIRLVRMVNKSTDKQTNRSVGYTPAPEQEPKNSNLNKIKSNDYSKQTLNISEVKLTSKKLGLVVYPSPHKPLHPIVQYHLKKLRSYHTGIDENWAKFAASAVVGKGSKYKRCVLPAICCVKEIIDPLNIEEKITNATRKTIRPNIMEAAFVPFEGAQNTGKPNEGQFSILRPPEKQIPMEELKRMKDCRVVIKKFDLGPGDKSLCTNHKRYNCRTCDVFKKPKSILKPVFAKNIPESLVNKETEHEKQVLTTSQPEVCEDIGILLAKKLRLFHPDSLTSIDSLKTLNHNAVELIKLRFIQKNFLHDYISIWYLKPEKPDRRARAFLTFSETPPVPKAINLRYRLDVNNLPKVIHEIVYAEKCLDPNEFVLLYCNGVYWEIHGSVNVAFNKSMKNSEQLIIPIDLPELKNLQDISYKMLKVKTVKWWVLDITQPFKIIELKSDKLISKISQKKILDFIKYYTYGFMPLTANSGGRTVGAYMIQNLVPYVLIGPYYLFEIHNVSLKGEFSTLPFVYNEVEDLRNSSALKYQISCTVKKAKKRGKTIEGLWLHYRAFATDSCLLEVMMALGAKPPSQNKYSIYEEHGYSLSSAALPALNQKIGESQDGNLHVDVYLYFDIFGLGYVCGELEEDNSVTIRHPLNEQTKVNSTDIGSWFLGIVRRRVQFVPNTLVVNWYITKCKSHLKNRQPFNRNFLNGSHILTDCGVFYILKLTDPNNQNGTYKMRKFLDAASKNFVMEEFVYLKVLSDMLGKNSNLSVSVCEVLALAFKEIKSLRRDLYIREHVKACLQEEKLGLFKSYLTAINLKGLSDNIAVRLLKQVDNLFFNKRGKIHKTFMRQLSLYDFGRQYLETVEKDRLIEIDKNTTASDLDPSKFVSSHSLSRPSKKIICVPTFQIVPNMHKTMEINSNSVKLSLMQAELNVINNKHNYSDSVLSKAEYRDQQQEQQNQQMSSVKEALPSPHQNKKCKDPERSQNFLKLTNCKPSNNTKVCFEDLEERKFEKSKSLHQNSMQFLMQL